jgi:nitrilase
MKTEKSKQARRKLNTQHFKVAVVQAAPVAFDRERTLKKVEALAREASAQGARLVLFPEAFVSAYPRGLDFGAVIGARTDAGREDFRRYWESSVDIPGPPVDALGRTAKRNHIFLVISKQTVISAR